MPNSPSVGSESTDPIEVIESARASRRAEPAGFEPAFARHPAVEGDREIGPRKQVPGRNLLYRPSYPGGVLNLE
jgi:hypothetical protein